MAELDMGREAVKARLCEAARLQRERGFVRKGVDMSAAAIASRLRLCAALSELCRRLAVVGQGLAKGKSER